MPSLILASAHDSAIRQDVPLDSKLIQRVIAIIERDLRRRIQPDLGTPASKLQIDYMIRLLQWISSQVGPFGTLDAAHEAALKSLVASNKVAELPAPSSSVQYAQPANDITDQLRRVAAVSSMFPTPFAHYVDLETAFVQSLDAEGGDGLGDIYEGGRLAGVQGKSLPKCDAATLSAYLQIRFDCPTAVGSDVAPLPGGFGKDTILFTIRGCGAVDGEAVIRKDFRVRPGPHAVTTEFPLLRALHGFGLPVAEPLWAETNDSIIGGAFIVSRRVAGKTAASDWQDSAELRCHFVNEFASLLAQLHSHTASTLLGQTDESLREAVGGHVQLYYEHYRSRARCVSGRLEAGFAWLSANLDVTDSTPARLVHGDVGFHNILMSDGKINALLDWEFAHFGDPAEDIGYCWQFIEKYVGWEEFMAMYARHGGTPVSYRQASFFRVWGDIRNAVMGVGALGTIDLSNEADIRSPSSALAFGPLLELQALRGAAEWNRNFGSHLAKAERAA